MTSEVIVTLIYLTPLLLIVAFYLYKRKKQHRISKYFLEQAENDGLTEPASLHPIIDPLKCLGCASCISACPEQNVLGLIDRHAYLVNPTNCIGHGACKTACPQNAINLVFGSEKRGVDIPELNTDFQTNIPGIFIAGELGGMGLIKNAIEQGRQSMNSIAKYVAKKPELEHSILDCVIVGAGPAGLSAMLGAKEKQLDIVTIDQDVAGGTVSHFPRGKLIMTSTANMPIVGEVKFGEVSKEKLLTFWLELIKKHDLKIHQNETMLDITNDEKGYFNLTSSERTYKTKSILLAIGRRGTPRKLDVEGEEQSKVVYRLIDAEQYKDEDILIVGGGDSALEAACSIAELGHCRVSISYRSDSFNRAKAKNRARIDELAACGKLQLLMSSQVNSISENKVQLTIQNEVKIIVNSVVIVCAGGVLPTPFLKKTGIMVATKYGAE
jgi:thioredoxin reductase/NAD-dependent dihydropyrimidine dehydrogenase PreA subunit